MPRSEDLEVEAAGGATFVGLLFAVPGMVLEKESKTCFVLLSFDGGDLTEDELESPPGTVGGGTRGDRSRVRFGWMSKRVHERRRG